MNILLSHFLWSFWSTTISRLSTRLKNVSSVYWFKNVVLVKSIHQREFTNLHSPCWLGITWDEESGLLWAKLMAQLRPFHPYTNTFVFPFSVPVVSSVSIGLCCVQNRITWGFLYIVIVLQTEGSKAGMSNTRPVELPDLVYGLLERPQVPALALPTVCGMWAGPSNIPPVCSMQGWPRTWGACAGSSLYADSGIWIRQCWNQCMQHASHGGPLCCVHSVLALGLSACKSGMGCAQAESGIYSMRLWDTSCMRCPGCLACFVHSELWGRQVLCVTYRLDLVLWV